MIGYNTYSSQYLVVFFVFFEAYFHLFWLGTSYASLVGSFDFLHRQFV